MTERRAASGDMSRPLPSRSRILGTSVAIGLALVLLYYAVREVEWVRVGSIIRSAKPLWLAFSVAIASSTLFLRACRWRVLLMAHTKVPVSVAFWAIACGYLGNNLLPARAGELLRAAFVSARMNFAMAYVLATAALERTADAITLIVVGGVVSLLVPNPPEWLSRVVGPLLLVAVCATLIIVAVPLVGTTLVRCPSQVQPTASWRARLSATAEQSVLGVGALHSRNRLGAFVGLTFLIWCLDASAMILGAEALRLHMPLTAAFLLLAGLGLSSALPSTPGYVGVFQFVAVTVLKPFGFSASEAMAYILVAQVLNYVVVGFWGTIGLWQYRKVASLHRAND